MSRTRNKKHFKMPYGKIALWTFLFGIISLFIIPIVSCISFSISYLCVLFRLIREAKKMDGGSLPWWYGGA